MLNSKGIQLCQIGRIRAPCCVFAGAKNAQGIAISILADILQVEHETIREGLDAASEGDG